MRSRKERGIKTEIQERRKQELHYGGGNFTATTGRRLPLRTAADPPKRCGQSLCENGTVQFLSQAF